MLAPSVGHYVFVRDDGQPLDFIPGQFIQVHFNYADGTATRRSYSLATMHDHALDAGETVEIAVSFVPGGSATALFEGLDIGGHIDASGPFGRFCLMPGDQNRRYLLIATGTGVTPYRAMLPQLEKLIAERGVEVVLLLGARTPQELLYGEDFRAFASLVKGKKKADGVTAWLVPGSWLVDKQIREEGIDKIVEAAGFEIRQPGCSACLAMNDDKIPAGKYSVSTSNRNFEGRQGPGSRTILASPYVAAAAAITGKITDPREFM